MKEICPIKDCTACYACENICAKNAITFKQNEYGVLYPIINYRICIDCKLCVKVCPNNSVRQFKTPITCYAAYRNDNEKRKRSSSGGIANFFSEYVIEKQNGSVWGVQSAVDFEAIYKEYTDLDSLEKTKGSQYVHSHVHDQFKIIKERLNECKKVLFIGLPCQVAGLLNYLGKDYSNLITCDLICHGVLPGSYLKEEIAFISKKIGIELATCSFRNNNTGSNYCLELYNYQGSSCYKKRAYLSPYFNSFLQAIALRPNCNECKYARPERIADITIGDYIGLGKDAPFDGITKNTSLVIINSERGEHFWELITATNDIVSFKRDYNKAVPFQPSLNAPFPAHRYTRKLLDLYKEIGFAEASRKILFFDILIRRLKRIVYIFFHLYKIPRKIIQCLVK